MIHEEASVVQLGRVVHLLPVGSANDKENDAGEEIEKEKKPEAQNKTPNGITLTGPSGGK
jgi:hypothetical protein